MKSQLIKLAIINPSDITEMILFSVVQDGAAEASRQAVSIEKEGSVVLEAGRTLITSKTYDVTVTGLFSSSALTQLEDWESNSTDVVFVGYTLDDRILIREGNVLFNQGFEGHSSFRFNSHSEASGGYDSSTGKHTSNMTLCKNALAMHKFGDANNDGVSDGWTISGTGTLTTTFSNGIQEFDVNGGTRNMYKSVYFPFPSKQITFGANVEVYSDAGSDGSVTLKVEGFDSSDTSTGSSNTVVSGLGGEQVTFTIPSGTVYLTASIINNDVESFRFSKPSLHLGATYSDNEFEEFNT